jgi:cystathionine beta-lyase
MIWLDCRKLGMPGKKLGEFFVGKANVGLNEGSTFGPGGDGFMRMNFATTHQKLKLAMDQIHNAVLQIR